MEDDAYCHYDNRIHGDASRFPVLQPQFRQPAIPAPPRDRYRASHVQHPHYDAVEDDGMYSRHGQMQLDSFDDRMLQHPYPDRQRQAEQGRARLSLAPGPSKFFSNTQPSQVSYQPREIARCEDTAQYAAEPRPVFRQDFSRFAYNDAHESSSDAQVGPSSSPALKAGQRRAEHSGHHVYRPDNERIAGRRDDDYADDSYGQAFKTPEPPKRRKSRDERLTEQKFQVVAPSIQLDQIRQQPKAINLPHAPPICQGIRLVPVSTLPDRLRTVFPYPTFNAVQSKCFDAVFKSNNNFVLASPTGSGKTVILELAICRAIATNATGQYKIVYQAPTKALCSERQRDWVAKFTPLGLKCAELTGDSDMADVRNVQSANVIITTPEKWDSITRKWKDHEKLMRLVKVFLVDEVHILKEDRGAVLEAVVSRMKSIGTDVRFVALSATVPNFHDVAAWLGRNSSEPYEPAVNEKFGEEFRPVKLRKHVCGYVYHNSNEFGFEKLLDAKLPEVIAQYSEGKPIMVFCATRNSCLSTAKIIANWWVSRQPRDRKWLPPSRALPLRNKDLRDTATSGVAFHHAGLDLDDRSQVERAFLSGDINVICCTSTLAVGVNLPCHLVIVKNTMSYGNEGMQEYSDLEMMQMLGRAGRPQFDDSAVAVIMTRSTKASRYEKMVTGQELLESKLHLNLIDHMNAEIGLGTIRDLDSARKWLTGTFLYVRLQQNPNHYKIAGARAGQNLEELIDDICFRDISLLREHNLVSGDEHFRCTEYGHSMAKYYVPFETMQVFLSIQAKATPSEILSTLAQATDFQQLRFRAGEKPFYKLLNKSPQIRFPIPVNIDLPAHKISLIIQAILGSADISWDGENAKHRSQFTTETAIVFKNIHSLIRCIIDCQLCLGDSISIHSALMIERSLGSRVWDDSPLQMKQIEGLGPMAVRKLVNAGVRSMEDLEICDAHRIETLLSRNPPFGMKVLKSARMFPKLRISLHAQPSSITKCPDGVKIQIKADFGLMNEKPPLRFAGQLVYVCILAETSDGRKIHFARISGQKLGNGQSLVFPALLTAAGQSVNCYVTCDSIAGSLRGATVKPSIAPSMFPPPQVSEPSRPSVPQRSNTSKRRAEPTKAVRKPSATSDEFGDDEINDEDLAQAGFGDLDFEHIDNFANPVDAVTRKNTAKNKSNTNKNQEGHQAAAADEPREPVQLENGKWACQHPCKDKQACKHQCCKEGMDKPPKQKPSKAKAGVGDTDNHNAPSAGTQKPKQTQSKLQLTASKRKISSAIEELDLTQQEKKKKADYARNGPRDYRDLHQLHKTVQKKDPPSNLLSVMHKKPSYCYSQGGEHELSFLPTQSTTQRPETSTDYGDIEIDEQLAAPRDEPEARHDVYSDYWIGNALLDSIPDQPGPVDEHAMARAPVASRGSDGFGDDDSLLGDVMIGLVDSQNLNNQDLAKDAPRETAAKKRDNSYDYACDFPDNDYDDFVAIPNYDEPDDISEHDEPDEAPTAAEKSRNKKNAYSARDICSQPRQTQPVPIPKQPITKQAKLSFPPATSSAASASTPHNPTSKPETFDTDIDVLDLIDAFSEVDDIMPSQPATQTHMPSPSTNHPKQKSADVEIEVQVPTPYRDLEPWLFREFGDCVELVD